MRNFFFLVGRGFRNIVRNPATSFFSLLVMITTIFLFSISYAALSNINTVVKQAENNVGITVFFNEGMTEEDIRKVGEKIGANTEVARMVFTSAEEAWEAFREVYFKGNEELAEGFIDNNPLANSASYEIFLTDITETQDFVEYLQRLEGVRKVNASNLLAEGLGNLGRILEVVSAVVLAALLAISIMLISNSISVAIAMRKDEIRIMRYIGATNGFIRVPFVLEGVILGLIGAALPLAAVWYNYDPAVHGLSKRLMAFGSLLTFLTRAQVFRILFPVALLLGIGIGVLGSVFAMRRHLRA